MSVVNFLACPSGAQALRAGGWILNKISHFWIDTNSKDYIAGGMAEWLKAAVLKTVECNSSVGSNPTPSAIF